MRGFSRASASWITWALALAFLVVIDRAITQTTLLWGATTFEHSGDLSRVAFAQTYQAARALYAPAAPGPIVLLGNSRIWLGAPAPLVNEALGGGAVANLGIFGAGLGDLEALSRHLPAAAPSLIVLTLGTSDLVGSTATPLAGVPARLLRIGWTAPPLGDESTTERLDRWLRTIWPLYRFREFARAAFDDRLVPATDEAPLARRLASPDAFHFASTDDVFATVHGDRAPEIAAAYRRWRAAPSLATFVDYVTILHPEHLALVRQRARHATHVEPDAPGVRLLGAVLARLTRVAPTILVLMPEQPILAEDTAGEFHHPGYSAAAAAAIERVARAHGVRIVDARGWMPADAFLDFDHLVPDVSGFHRRLATEIARDRGT